MTSDIARAEGEAEFIDDSPDRNSAASEAARDREGAVTSAEHQRPFAIVRLQDLAIDEASCRSDFTLAL